MSESTSYKEEIIRMLDDLSEAELEGLYRALQASSVASDEEEEVDLDERLVTSLTVQELEGIIFEAVEDAMLMVAAEVDLANISEEEAEFIDDFMESFHRFLEETPDIEDIDFVDLDDLEGEDEDIP